MRFLGPISIQTKNPMFGAPQPFSFRSCTVVSFKTRRDATTRIQSGSPTSVTMSKSSSSSILSFTMQINFSRLSLKIKQLSAHIMPRNVYSLSCCPPKDTPQPLARHFSSVLQSTYLATRPHSTGASTPPWRMHRDTLAVLEACGAADVLHFCEQGRRQVSVDSRQGKDLGYH